MKNGIAVVVNKEQQKEILKLLPDFVCSNLSPKFDFKFPLIIRFDEKTIHRLTSITCCAALSTSKAIIYDYNLAKSKILDYLQNQNTDTNNINV